MLFLSLFYQDRNRLYYSSLSLFFFSPVTMSLFSALYLGHLINFYLNYKLYSNSSLNNYIQTSTLTSETYISSNYIFFYFYFYYPISLTENLSILHHYKFCMKSRGSLPILLYFYNYKYQTILTH